MHLIIEKERERESGGRKTSFAVSWSSEIFTIFSLSVVPSQVCTHGNHSFMTLTTETILNENSCAGGPINGCVRPLKYFPF